MKVVYVNTIGDKHSGAVKQAYRHVDVLNQLGIDAYVATDSECKWFENTTKTIPVSAVELTADDFLVFGETVRDIPQVKGADRCGKVILCHNEYDYQSGFEGNLFVIRKKYTDAAAILCASENAKKNLQFMFPASNVMRVRPSFDRKPLFYNGKKEPFVSLFLSSKKNKVGDIVSVTGLRWIPEGWKLWPMENIPESQVVNTMGRSALFISLNEHSGFGLAMAEAMACGCVVVGYTGLAGSEFLRPGISFPIQNGDFLEMANKLVELFVIPMPEIVEIGHKASTFIRSEYSTAKEVESVNNAWSKITRPVVEITTQTTDRMKKEVAAYMPVYNEGPYMECLLKWLIPRVGAIFVAESIVPWSPTAQPGGKSKAIVDKVIADCPEAKDKIKYIGVGNNENKDKPLVREAKQRNEVIGCIKAAGFKFVWMVEADEFYRNDEAVALWSWFFDRVEDGAKVARCKWHTYWRSLHWRIDPPENFYPSVAFMSDCTFSHGRVLSICDEDKSVEVPERICVIRHYSWARTPSDVRNKLAAWGHSKELNPEWYDKVFMPWTPGSSCGNLHPTHPENYKTTIHCDLPIPEALEGHPFLGKDIIEDVEYVMVDPVVCLNPSAKVTVEVPKPRIKAVIMHHNKPENADRLYEQLAPVFDDVEIFDNGSDSNLIPIHTTRSRENVYWAGTWNEVLETCSDYDAVWVLGCDIVLLNTAKEYRDAIESSLPFGCWSPCIRGRAHPFMQEKYFSDKQPKSVRNIEGMALALSGPIMREIKKLLPGSPIGFGHDFWMCYRSRQMGMKNIIDGRVVVHHPPGIGYDELEALKQMQNTFSASYGEDFRFTIFQYDERFEYNVIGERVMADKKFTIVTIDNGWGLSEFIRITSKMGPDVRKIVMRKGIIDNVPVEGVEFVPYNLNLESLIREASVAFFPRVGMVNKEDYTTLLRAGIATVVRESCSQGLITHEKNGWLFRDEMWAHYWLNFLKENPAELERVKRETAAKFEDISLTGVQTEPIQKFEEKTNIKRCVTIITPTYKRDLKVIQRCVGSLLLQTKDDWEQIICSDGNYEPEVAKYVEGLKDPRIRYCHTEGKKDGDFGNTVRSEMLEQANGDFVFFFDDDNVILPTFFEKMLSAIRAADSDLAICQIMHFGPLNEKEVGRPPIVLKGDPVKLYHIDPLQVLVKREVMQEVGWDTEVGYLSDGVSLEKLANRKIVRVDEILGIHM